MRNLVRFTALALGVLIFNGCKDDDDNNVTPTPDKNPPANTGWYGQENLETTPTTTNFGNNNASLPASVDLTPKFPPIGDQGQYGTCVTWAAAYNLKTALNGMSKNLSTSALASANNQYSPKDLFMAIPDNMKGQNCNGTNFEAALDQMQGRGVATLQTVPYTGLTNCSSTGVQSAWTSEANGHKIKYWRKLDPTVENIKQNLANNIPVVFGAKLADNFMSWNSDQVLSSVTSYNNVGQHAYHALIIAGYDNGKGANGAFKIINSWGTNWGDQGYIWVDYNFFMNTFCTDSQGKKPLFIAADESGSNNPPDNNPNPPSAGVDVAPWAFSDESLAASTGDPQARVIDFNLYNIGTQAATPAQNWSMYYIYYNAYDANDYGVLFYDEFNTNIASNTYDCPQDDHCILNVSIPAGNDLAAVAFGTASLYQTYRVPQITGEYYLVLLADAFDVMAEEDEENNIFYTTLDPKTFFNGQSTRQLSGRSHTYTPLSKYSFHNPLAPSAANLKRNPYHSAVTPVHRNAYTPDEISAFIKSKHASGELRKKAMALKKSGTVQALTPHR